MFRPINSSESNLYTIRATVGNMPTETSGISYTTVGTTLYTIASYNGLKSASASSYVNSLISPSKNNLPSGFYIDMEIYAPASPNVSNTHATYYINYGNTFTSPPSIYITPNMIGIESETTTLIAPSITSKTTTQAEFLLIGTFYNSTNTNGDGTSTGGPIILLNSKFPYTHCAIPYYNSVTPINKTYGGFDIIITGPVKMGVNTGNSNKGWALNDSSTADPLGTYTSLDVSLGGTATTTNSISICKNLKLLDSSGSAIKTFSSGAQQIITADYYNTVWLLNATTTLGATGTPLTPQQGMVLIITNISTSVSCTITAVANSIITPSGTKTTITLPSGSSITLYGISNALFSVLSTSGTVTYP